MLCLFGRVLDEPPSRGVGHLASLQRATWRLPFGATPLYHPRPALRPRASYKPRASACSPPAPVLRPRAAHAAPSFQHGCAPTVALRSWSVPARCVACSLAVVRQGRRAGVWRTHLATAAADDAHPRTRCARVVLTHGGADGAHLARAQGAVAAKLLVAAGQPVVVHLRVQGASTGRRSWESVLCLFGREFWTSLPPAGWAA